jgi:hypothetical protein
MVTVTNCSDIQEALRLQMALQAAEIPSVIPDEATACNAPYLFAGASAGVRLPVAEKDVHDAERIIAEVRKQQS